MTWRPWVIASLAVVALLVNGMLLINENVPDPTQQPELDRPIKEPLRDLLYTPTNRRANFQSMGMSFELAEAAASHIGRFDRQQPRWERMVDDQGAELAEALCASERLPQPYAMLAFLVYQDNDARYVFDPLAMTRFERQSWYDDRALVPALYNQFERAPSRRVEATLMGVSAALLAREADALEGRSPWALGLVGQWGFARLKRRQPGIERLVVEYFSLMHYLTELANTRRGICS